MYRPGIYNSAFHYFFDSESARVTEDIYLLPICNKIGLIVTTAKGGGKGDFIRLGLFWIDTSELRYKDLVRIPGATMDEALYAEIPGPDEWHDPRRKNGARQDRRVNSRADASFCVFCVFLWQSPLARSERHGRRENDAMSSEGCALCGAPGEGGNCLKRSGCDRMG